MKISIHRDNLTLGAVAGRDAATLIKATIASRGAANIILATGTSQFETLHQLIADKEIDWSKVVMFHLDEYIGLSDNHAASFRKYLRERFINQIPSPRAAHLINGEGDAAAECQRLGTLIRAHPIDVALVGIGENGHLAFNDPPADFDIEDPYLIVQLDDQCVAQQFGEGWFPSLDDVPRKAISMSIRQIMKSQNIICSVPDSRKAVAVRDCLNAPVTNLHPASILQMHERCTIYLDAGSASLLPLPAQSSL